MMLFEDSGEANKVTSDNSYKVYSEPEAFSNKKCSIRDTSSISLISTQHYTDL